MGAVLGAVLDVSASTVMRHWQANGLKPHILRGFKVSRDPKFVEKLEDIVGLYLSPPEPALGLCCDEKSQVQALEQWPRLSEPQSPTFKWTAGGLQTVQSCPRRRSALAIPDPQKRFLARPSSARLDARSFH